MCDDKLEQIQLPVRQDDQPRERRSHSHGRYKVVERFVDIETRDGVADAVLHHPDEPGVWPSVLVWPDIMGLRPVFRDMGTRLAAQGYNVLTPNLYYRVTHAPVVDPTFNFADADHRKRIFGLRATLSDAHVEIDGAAYVAFLDQLPQTASDHKIGVHGYCLGGAFAVRAAAVAPGRIGAVASFHGAGLVIEGDSSPHLLIPRTRARYLIAIAQNDDEQDPKARKTIASTIAQAGRSGLVEVFPAKHGWCVGGSASYDEIQADEAWGRLLSLYQESLKST